jgi:uncharacterized protein GlcG (DUF336 family)
LLLGLNFRAIMTHAIFERLEPRRLFDSAALTAADVSTILAQAADFAKPTQAIVVVDRTGLALGEYDKSGLNPATSTLSTEMIAEIRIEARLRAKTAALFESAGEAFTTRTARFIIQDHFPYPVLNSPGGPLYGVEFSSTAGTDILTTDDLITPDLLPFAKLLSPLGISGDPGGIPLYKSAIVNGVKTMQPVGAIGVAGDFKDVAPRSDLILGNIKNPSDPTQPLFQYAAAANPQRRVFNGGENPDFDESVARAGAIGFIAPDLIRASHVFLNGLRLPFLSSPTATGPKALRLSLSALLAKGDGILLISPVDDSPEVFPSATYAGIAGFFQRTNERAHPRDVGQNFAPVASNDTAPGTADLLPDDQLLTVSDVNTIITNAVAQAKKTRAGIRKPIGVDARVYVTVVDRDGDLLGVFREGDTTNFSFDVAVQKARTAAFFSDNTDAFSTRAIGFISQRYFPVGIGTGLTGPLFQLQDAFQFDDVSSTGAIVDSTIKPIGTVTAAIANPEIQVVPVSGPLSVGQIITFGNDTSREYIVETSSSAGITVRLDGIDLLADPPAVLTAGEAIRPKNPLKNGMTIFPGGEPLYINNILVGAIGVSGDGVDQDDIISYAGTAGFRPSAEIRSDQLGSGPIISFISSRIQTLEQTYSLGTLLSSAQAMDLTDLLELAQNRLASGLAQLRLPYVKFPRNPEI